MIFFLFLFIKIVFLDSKKIICERNFKVLIEFIILEMKKVYIKMNVVCIFFI